VSTLEQRAAAYRPAVEAEMRAVVGEARGPFAGWMRYHLGWEDRDGGELAGARGKMLRPVALLLAHEVCGGRWERAVPAAAAVELVHNFSLLHDDVEDGSDMRHGRATLWTFAGEAQAINTGDGMYTVARLAMYRLLGQEFPADRVVVAMRELDGACLRLVEGQYLDLAFEQRASVSSEEYLEMARGKTAAMFAAPFATGALLAGAPEATVQAFRQFGEHVGLAFQAVDDVLGIWGDPAVTGKPAGDDLRTRKRSLPVVAALESGHAAAEEVARLYATPPGAEDDAEIGRIAGLLQDAGARLAAESMAREQEARALEALRGAGLPYEAVDLCAEFANAATRRVT
jgi:geranylgeranyl diphosphate synthase, type I